MRTTFSKRQQSTGNWSVPEVELFSLSIDAHACPCHKTVIKVNMLSGIHVQYVGMCTALGMYGVYCVTSSLDTNSVNWARI